MSEEIERKGIAEKFGAFLQRYGDLFFSCLAVGLACCLYAALQAGRGMTPTEGWYSYYASLINEEGAVPYVDFELLFPPLYVYLIAFITNIFGYDLIVLRIFGVFVYTATGIFACLIFARLFKKPLLGAVGGLLVTAFLQSESAQIFYDYIRLMDLSVYISVYFFLCYFDHFFDERKSEKKIDINVVLGSIFAVLASLYKQSSGLIFLIFCFMALLYFRIFFRDRKQTTADIFVFLAAVVLLYGLMILFLAAQGALGGYFYYNFVASVGAKGGSIVSVLFGWFGRTWKMVLLCLPFSVLAAGVVIAEMAFARKSAEGGGFRAERVCILVIALLAAAVVVLSLFCRGYAGIFSGWAESWRRYVSFLFSLILFAFLGIALLFRKKIGVKAENLPLFCKYFYLAGTAAILGYAVSTSGSLGESQVALAFGVMVVSFAGFCRLRFPKKEVVAIVTSAFMLFDIGISFAVKTQSVYSWWGLEAGSYWEQTEECDIPIFRGIKMSESYAVMYNNVYREVLENTDPDDEIFVFPHMPILYLATGRRRATFTALQWFDVSSDKAVKEDIDVLREKKPVLMILCFIPDYVRESHEESFREGEQSGLSTMQEFLREFVAEENYVLLSSDTVCEGYSIQVYRLPEEVF